jgi:hypothetical protein
MLVFNLPSFYLMIAPRHKSSDFHNSFTSKRNHTLLPLSENVKLLNLREVDAEVAKFYSEAEAHIHGTVKKEKQEG